MCRAFVRPFVPVALLALGAVSACQISSSANPLPKEFFYFPTGLVHADSTAAPDGVLYVANANIDKRYEAGSVVAINLSRVGAPGDGLPSFGGAGAVTAPKQIPALNIEAPGVVSVTSFAGDMAARSLLTGGLHLFVPSRSEGSKLQGLVASPLSIAGAQPELSCLTPATSESRDCGALAPSLVVNENNETATPRAPSPIGVAVSAAGDVYVTSAQHADSPRGSGLAAHAYVVRVDAQNPTVDNSNFIDLGLGPTSAVATGARWAYVTGRFSTYNNATVFYVLRLVGRDGTVVPAGLENEFRVADARGVDLVRDESRIYIAGRFPDTLIVASIVGAQTSAPTLHVVRSVPLPEGPQVVKVLERAGRGPVVAVTSTTAGVVSFYDDDSGQLASQVFGVGLQPYGISVDFKGAGARLYVSNFGDGRIAVIDIADLGRPQEARLVAHLGASVQVCLSRANKDATCEGAPP